MKPSILARFSHDPPLQRPVVASQALAVAGLSVLGRDRFGVFPLRGKLRNARRLGSCLKVCIAEAVNQAFVWI